MRVNRRRQPGRCWRRFVMENFRFLSTGLSKECSVMTQCRIAFCITIIRKRRKGNIFVISRQNDVPDNICQANYWTYEENVLTLLNLLILIRFFSSKKTIFSTRISTLSQFELSFTTLQANSFPDCSLAFFFVLFSGAVLEEENSARKNVQNFWLLMTFFLTESYFFPISCTE